MSDRIVFWFLLLWLVIISCGEKEKAIIKMDFDALEPMLLKKNDSLYIVNFWATWCTPCRKEIPALEKINDSYKNQKVKVLLVSLDLGNQHDDKLKPFIKEYKIRSEVIHLIDPRQNMWINKVDPDWSGSIPFTLIYSKNFRKTYEKVFQYEELDSLVKIHLKQ